MTSPACKPAAAAGELSATLRMATVAPRTTGSPIRAMITKTTIAVRKFMPAPAPMKNIRSQGPAMFTLLGLAMPRRRASTQSLEACSSPTGRTKSSPSGRTKPPRGSQFSVYSVPLRSKRRAMRGGKPSPNSRMVIPTSLPAMKCPSSCRKMVGTSMMTNEASDSRKSFMVYLLGTRRLWPV